VVTHIDNKIKVLDIISISENEEIDIIVRYWTELIEAITTSNSVIIV
jgi:hypothetical protein